MAIDVSWADRRLARDTATDQRGVRRFGPEQWAVLRRRLAVLRAAPSLADLWGSPGRLHPLKANRAGQFSLDLRGPTRLIFEPNHEPVPRQASGALDQRSVTAIRVLEVTDTHD